MVTLQDLAKGIRLPARTGDLPRSRGRAGAFGGVPVAPSPAAEQPEHEEREQHPGDASDKASDKHYQFDARAGAFE